MSDFGKNILFKLLSKYQNSVLSKKGSDRNIKIRLTLKDKELSTYTCSDSYNYRDSNDATLSLYEKEGFITVVKDKYGDFDSLVLIVENVEKIYDYLNIKSPSRELKDIQFVLEGNAKKGSCATNFICFCKKWIDEKSSPPKSYFETADELKDILLALFEIEKLNTEIKLRDFSVNVYGDSKRFEQIKSKVARIIFEFDEECGIDNFCAESVGAILEEKNLISNPSYAILKGNIVIKIKNLLLDMETFDYEFCLSDKMIDDLEIISSNANKVITIENLTTFYNFRDEKSIVVYLGGFHSHTKRMLLEKIYKQYPQFAFYHFGDIDAGGIHILKHLRFKTQINVIPYKMDIETLLAYKSKWKKLTANDERRLSKIQDDEFIELINFMLDNNCKLEQESIDL